MKWIPIPTAICTSPIWVDRDTTLDFERSSLSESTLIHTQYQDTGNGWRNSTQSHCSNQLELWTYKDFLSGQRCLPWKLCYIAAEASDLSRVSRLILPHRKHKNHENQAPPEGGDDSSNRKERIPIKNSGWVELRAEHLCSTPGPGLNSSISEHLRERF